MARKQTEFAGFERQISNPAIEEAAQAYCEIRDKRAELSKKEGLKMLELLAVLKMHGVAKYDYYDDNGEVLTACVKVGAEKAVVVKSGDAESSVGEGVSYSADQEATPHAGLIAQAERAQSDANVSEDADGDVVVPEKAAAKRATKKKRKAN